MRAIKAIHHKTTYQMLQAQRLVKEKASEDARKEQRKMTLEFIGMGAILVCFAVSFIVGFWELHAIGLK